MTTKKPHVLGGVEHTEECRRTTSAKLRGIARSIEDGIDAKTVDPVLLLIPLLDYGLALVLGIEVPTIVRRWAETLDAATLRASLGHAALADEERASYWHTGDTPSWFFHVALAIRRITLPAFVADPDSPLGLLHAESFDW